MKAVLVIDIVLVRQPALVVTTVEQFPLTSAVPKRGVCMNRGKAVDSG